MNRAFKHINPKIYVPMQGPSELGASGKLVDWDRTADLAKITVPTLVIGAQHDTMDPEHMEWMARQLPQRALPATVPNGSHMAMYDDQQVYFDGLIRFLRDVDGGDRRSRARGAAGFQAMLAEVDTAQLETAERPGRRLQSPVVTRATTSPSPAASGGRSRRAGTAIGPRLDWVGALSSRTAGPPASASPRGRAATWDTWCSSSTSVSWCPARRRRRRATIRVTMLFRREAAGWRIIHRQADSNLERQPPR